jgi:hypothetical protein
MVTTTMTAFCKSEDCPTSSELLEFQGAPSSKRAAEIHRHLDTCEFCAAESAFYLLYPQEDQMEESVETVGIPAPLFQLAEALLKKKHSDPSSLDSLILPDPPVLAGC